VDLQHQTIFPRFMPPQFEGPREDGDRALKDANVPLTTTDRRYKWKVLDPYRPIGSRTHQRAELPVSQCKVRDVLYDALRIVWTG
jgi:hypothetical protein